MTHQLAAIINSQTTNRVARTIDRHSMIVAGDRVLAAVSGGADSTALLHILHALAENLEIELAVAHLNHGLRGRAANDDARFVERMARRLELNFHGDRIQLGSSAGSLEDKGRQARYAFFHRLAKEHGYTKIALGHHMNDNAEAVLMHLLRGSGIRGLSGIPPVRSRRIIRPLIDLRRSEIIRFLQDHQIACVEDASNMDLRFDRNRVRRILIPFLQKQFNTDVVAVLNRTADLCWHEDRWLQSLLGPILGQIVTSSDPEGITLDVQKLAAQPLAARRRLIRDGLRQWRGTLKGIRADHIDRLIGLLTPQSEGKRICLPNRIAAERSRQNLIFSIRHGRGCLPKPSPPDYYYEIILPGSGSVTIDVPESGFQLQADVVDHPGEESLHAADRSIAWFEMDQITFPLVVRNFRPGDRMRPLGLQGRQKIKKIFGDRKIPRPQRHRTPILTCGNEILWVAGIRRSSTAIPTGRSVRLLRVRLVKPPD